MEDLTGRKFGRLTVIARGEDYVNPNSGKRRPRWICKCDCGCSALCQAGALKNGRAKSCGCLRNEIIKQPRGPNHERQIDITWQRFGKLTAIKPVGKSGHNGILWECRCDCGNIINRDCADLRSGNVKSCGCFRNEKISAVNRKHGESHKSRLYSVWVGMRQRCNDPNHKSYHNYGGRGISVCEEWNDFAIFKRWALENGYDADAKYGECTLDRIDVDGNYKPSNCRWVDSKTQAKNKRNKTE